MRVSATTRFHLRLIGLGFALGVMFQTGIGVASHFWPRIEVIEIRTTVDQGAPAPSRHQF